MHFVMITRTQFKSTIVFYLEKIKCILFTWNDEDYKY